MESSKQNNGMTIVAIGSIPLILTLGNSMLIPILPKMKSELHLSQFQVSLVITVFSLIAAFTIPIVGYLADRFSRKIIIIPCLILYGAGGLLAGFAAGFLTMPFLGSWQDERFRESGQPEQAQLPWH